MADERIRRRKQDTISEAHKKNLYKQEKNIHQAFLKFPSNFQSTCKQLILPKRKKEKKNHN
jgi:hypothetical protein